MGVVTALNGHQTPSSRCRGRESGGRHMHWDAPAQGQWEEALAHSAELLDRALVLPGHCCHLEVHH